MRFLRLESLARDFISLFLEDAVVVVVAPHDPAGRGLLDAQQAGGMSSGHPLLIDHSDQFDSHLSGKQRTSRVYFEYFLPSQEFSVISIDFLKVYSNYYYISKRKMLEFNIKTAIFVQSGTTG